MEVEQQGESSKAEAANQTSHWKAEGAIRQGDENGQLHSRREAKVG